MSHPIVGIGEVLWDIYPDGRKVAGGAPFNFAFHCHQLGHEGVIVSRVGDDDLGCELRDEVLRLGLSDDFIQTDREHPTGTVKVTLDEKKVPTYTITEDVAWDYIRITDALINTAQESRALCFGTLAQRSGIARSTIRRLKARCWDQAERKVLIILDVNLREPFTDRQILVESLHLCNWIKLNHEEVKWFAEVIPLRNQDEKVAPIDLRLVKHTDLVCVTRGAEGCRLVTQTDDFSEPAVPANVVDTVGAGDAFTAAMVCLHLEGRTLRDCARFANHYAARVCEFQGATPRIDRAEVERAAFGA